jgi:hypothetical protein
MAALSSYTLKTPPAGTDFLLGCDSGGTVKTFDVGEFVTTSGSQAIAGALDVTSAGGVTVANGGGNGYAGVVPGSATNSGHVAFYAASTTRVGYIGNADATDLFVVAEGGRNVNLSGAAIKFNGTATGTAAFKNMAVSTSAPGSPATNDLWIDTT